MGDSIFHDPIFHFGDLADNFVKSVGLTLFFPST